MNSFKQQLLLTFLISILMWMLTSCEEKKETSKNILASVNDRVLTREMVISTLPEDIEGLDSLRWLRNITKQWIDDEILFQYAIKNGFLNQPEIAFKADEVQKRYIAALVENQFQTGYTIPISQTEIDEYYQKHGEEFRSPRKLFRVAYFTTIDRGDEEQIRKEFRDMADWKKISETYTMLNESKTDSTGVILNENGIMALLKTENLFLVNRLRVDRLNTFPIKTDDGRLGILILAVKQIIEKNSPLPKDMITNEIRGRLYAVKYRNSWQSKVDSIRKSMNVKVLIN